jgi:hypothetical protein
VSQGAHLPPLKERFAAVSANLASAVARKRARLTPTLGVTSAIGGSKCRASMPSFQVFSSVW